MTELDGGRTVMLPGSVAMPLIGFGTWQLRGNRGYEALRRALAAGYRHIDTATMYGNEAEVGRAVRDSGLDRRDVFITTKLPPGRAGQEQRTLAESLRALDTDYVDLWLVHWPPRSDALLRTWERFRQARDQGLARSIGVSNYGTAELDRVIDASGEAPAVNQIRWAPSLHDPKRLAAHRERSIVLEGYSPFKSSDLRHPVLTRIAAAHGVTTAQVVLRWHLEYGIPVIPKSQTPERIVANLDVFGFELTADDVAAIDGLSRY